MIVRVQLFAAAREAAGCEVVEVELPAPGTVGTLRQQLIQSVPALRHHAAQLLIAVDCQYAQDDVHVGPDSEIAAFPPVSGG